MRIQLALLVSLFVAAPVQAQSAPSTAPAPAGAPWSVPAPASSAGYRSDDAVTTERTHFKFRERRSPVLLPGNAAREQSGQAPVGVGTIDRNGRPAVSCPQTPMDPACH